MEPRRMIPSEVTEREYFTLLAALHAWQTLSPRVSERLFEETTRGRGLSSTPPAHWEVEALIVRLKAY